MNIILGEENAKTLAEKYVVLELDTFRLPGQLQPITAYCIAEDLPLTEVLQLEQWRNLHERLIRNYQTRNWDFCRDAIKHLMGRWGGQLDSFYQEIETRITTLETSDLDDDWDGVIDRA